ncbi:MAG TPA: hypothetical protein VLI90_17400 [Tepidisphaeraceae bacterium]|nr:hypothetical protein [Tepidisphaeraceae bacterium]
MTYRGHIKNGQVALDEPVSLPEGAEVSVVVIEKKVRITRPKDRQPLGKFRSIELQGGPLSDDIIRDRR